MKFTPENLIQIYLDGSFTEEAQAEFDSLMRKDPVFAEQVTKAVAERLGPAPDSLVDGVATRLDGKIDGIWREHKPSPYGSFLKKVALVAVLGVVAGSLYLGYRHFGGFFHSSAGILSKLSAGQKGMDSASAVVPSQNGQTALISANEEAREGKGAQPHPSLKHPAPVGETSGSNRVSSRGPDALSAKAPSGKSNDSQVLSSARSSVGQGAAAAGSGSPQVSGLHSSQRKESSALPSMAADSKTEEGFPLLIPVEIDKAQKVEMSVMDSKGFPIRQLYAGVWVAGTHTVEWDGKDGFGNLVPPGPYTVILNAGGKTISHDVNVPTP